MTLLREGRAPAGPVLGAPAGGSETRGALVAVRQPPTWVTVAVLTVLGAVVRLLSGRSFWIDEATSLRQALLPFHEMIRTLADGDVHPPLYHILLWVDIRAFGTSEVAVRLPSVVIGTLLIPTLFVTGRDLYDRRTGLVAAVFGVVAPQAVWYAQEARMYAPFMLFATVAVWAQFRAVQAGGRRSWYWVLFAVASAALLWTQYFAALHVLTQQLAFLAVLWRRKRQGRPVSKLFKAWLLSAVAIVLLLAPLAPYLHDQLVAYRQHRYQATLPAQAGNEVAGGHNTLSVYTLITNLLWAFWGYHSDRTMSQIVALWPLGMLLLLLMLGGRGREATTRSLLALVAGPVGALFLLVSFQGDLLGGQSLFEVRYFASIVPMLVLLSARAVTSFAPSRMGCQLLAAAVVLSLTAGLADQRLNHSNPRWYDFRGALLEIDHTAQPGDVILYQPAYLGTLVHYYAPSVRSRPLEDGLPGPASRGHIFILASLNFASAPFDTRATNDAVKALSRTHKLTERRVRPNVIVWGFG